MIRHPARVALIAAAVLAASGCQDRTGRTDGPRPTEDAGAAPLAGVPIRSGDLPEGLRVVPESTGRVASLQDLLPPPRNVPVPPVPPRVRDAFRDGFQSSFVSEPDGGGPGPASAASFVVRFETAEAASTLLRYLQDVQGFTSGELPPPEPVAVTDLGEETFGWHRRVPGGESSGYVWRTGPLVLSVTMGGPAGTASPEASLALARRVNDRVP